MKILESYVQLLGTEEKLKMKPLININERFRELKANYVDEQLDSLFNRLDLDEDDLAVQHRQWVHRFLNKAEKDYPNNKGIGDILDVVRKKNLGRYFVQTAYDELEHNLKGIVDPGLKESTARSQKRGSRPLQSKVDDEPCASDDSGGEVEQQ